MEAKLQIQEACQVIHGRVPSFRVRVRELGATVKVGANVNVSNTIHDRRWADHASRYWADHAIRRWADHASRRWADHASRRWADHASRR